MYKKLMIVGLLIGWLSGFAFGQQAERDMEKEKAIWQALQAIAPKTVEDFKAATAAMDEGNYEQAAQLYEKVLAKAPDYDVVQRRLGVCLSETERTADGRSFLEQALATKRSPENLGALAAALAFPGKGRVAPKPDKQRALTLIKSAFQADAENDPYYALLLAQISLEAESPNDFREAVRTLSQKHPQLMATHYFSAVAAAMDEDWLKAVAEINVAQSLGLPAEQAKAFLDSGVQSRATVWRYVYYSLALTGVWALGLLTLFGLGKALSNRTMRSLETSDPNGAASDQEVSLRKLYRRLINVAGVYYYISLPFVVILVIAVTASVSYAFFVIGYVPIKLLIVLAIGALVTIYKMIRSLFVRVQAEDPGRPLRPDEAPGLWAMTRAVAERLGTRPIDEIRITPGTDLAVYEKGSFKERAQDRARRILVLGVGVLNDFQQGDFRAVLAHEYGHFSHRDTAGGDVALRVRSDIMKFAEAMVLSGQAVWWNMGFQFLHVYDFIFRRITHGATRLQEVLADRVAARQYGADHFEGGLRHAIRRTIEFEDIAYWEIDGAAKERRNLANLYDMAANPNNAIEEKFNEAINRPTTQDDTHPSPVERFRLTKKIISREVSPAAGTVWEWFTDREALTKEMSALIDSYLRAAH